MKVLETYDISAKGVKHLVEVFDTKPVKSYKLSMPRFSNRTEMVLHEIKRTVVNQISFPSYGVANLNMFDHLIIWHSQVDEVIGCFRKLGTLLWRHYMDWL